MNSSFEANIEKLLYQINGLNGVETIRFLNAEFPAAVTFSTSFSYEDQIITHEIFSHDLDVKVFTLDTGRLFPETYSVWNSTLVKYGKPIRAYYPNAHLLEDFVGAKGPNSFYESVENRKS